MNRRQAFRYKGAQCKNVRKRGKMQKEKPTTKVCKHCKTEIPFDAKICPQCRKKQGGNVKWIVIAVIAILIISGTLTEDDEPKKVDKTETSSSETNSNTDTSKENTDKTTTFTIGDTAELNDVQVTMVDYEESTGSDFNKPADGNVFVLVKFEIANNSDAELTISSIMSFDAYADDYSLNYSLGAIMEKPDNSQLDGTIAAGKKMNGWIGYEVPTDWKNIEIHFTDNAWSNNEFVFNIDK